MADFNKAFPRLIDIEGKLSNDSNDYGGLTKYGIAKRFYPELDIANLTLEDAKAIYKRDFWDKMRLDEIDDQRIAFEMFEISVNMHWSRALKFAQEACNLLDRKVVDQLVVDGLIGPKTLSAINTATYPQAVVIFLNGCQFMHYRQRAIEDKSQENFLNGWLLKRVSFKEE